MDAGFDQQLQRHRYVQRDQFRQWSQDAANVRDPDCSERGLAELYRYDLVHRNCATELFAVLNRSIGRICEQERGGGSPCKPEMVREESVQRLGGFVDGSGWAGVYHILKTDRA